MSVPVVPVAFALAGFAGGAVVGGALAARGVTAENALKGRRWLAAGLLAAAGVVAVALFFPDRVPGLGPAVQLWVQHLTINLTVMGGSFSIGLLLLMEWPGRKEKERARRLRFGVGVLSVLVGVLLWRSGPVEEFLGPATIYQGVVMQTTGYTCAPASIATLARWVGADTAATERETSRLTATTRWGTNTIMEVRAMEALGLRPRFALGLTLDSLLVHGGPALLHVDEPVGPRTIRHAVALLEVDREAGTVTLGNPLEGRQVKAFSELDGYWIGEAVFVEDGAPVGTLRGRGSGG